MAKTVLQRAESPGLRNAIENICRNMCIRSSVPQSCSKKALWLARLLYMQVAELQVAVLQVAVLQVAVCCGSFWANKFMIY